MSSETLRALLSFLHIKIELLDIFYIPSSQYSVDMFSRDISATYISVDPSEPDSKCALTILPAGPSKLWRLMLTSSPLMFSYLLSLWNLHVISSLQLSSPWSFIMSSLTFHRTVLFRSNQPFLILLPLLFRTPPSSDRVTVVPVLNTDTLPATDSWSIYASHTSYIIDIWRSHDDRITFISTHAHRFNKHCAF